MLIPHTVQLSHEPKRHMLARIDMDVEKSPSPFQVCFLQLQCCIDISMMALFLEHIGNG